MQIGIVVLVAALMSGAIVSVLARVVAQQSGERVLGIAHTVALMPAVRDAFNSPDPAASLQPLAGSLPPAAGGSFGLVANPGLVPHGSPGPGLDCKFVPEPPLPSGRNPGGRAPGLGRESFLVEEDGSLGRSI